MSNLTTGLSKQIKQTAAAPRYMATRESRRIREWNQNKAFGMRRREKDYSTFHSNVRVVGFKEEEEKRQKGRRRRRKQREILIRTEKAAEFTQKSPAVRCRSQRRGVKMNGSNTFNTYSTFFFFCLLMSFFTRHQKKETIIWKGV